MGISPYLTASLALSFALQASPELRRWRKDAGAEGSDVVGQWARRLGLLCSLLQALWTAMALRPFASPVLLSLPLHEYLCAVVFPLAAGTSCLMWLAEEITRTGIGQGTSVAISLSIAAGYAHALRTLLPQLLAGAVSLWAAAGVAAAVCAQTALAVLVTEGVRKVPIAFFQLQAAPSDGRAGGATPLGGDHIPFRCNPSGVQPVLLSYLLLEGLPWALAALQAPQGLRAAVGAALSPAAPLLYVLCFSLVFAACFIDLEDTPKEVAEYILKVGARVPGVRPGDATVAHLREVQLGARFWGGAMLGLLSTGSLMVDKWMHAAYGRSIGFTSLLIIVRRAPAQRSRRSHAHRRLGRCFRCAGRFERSRRSRGWLLCSRSCESAGAVGSEEAMTTEQKCRSKKTRTDGPTGGGDPETRSPPARVTVLVVAAARKR